MEDFVIIGSGVAGSTIAKELREKYGENCRIAIIEKGDNPKYISEGKNVEVNYICGVGGSGIYSLGNAIKTKIKGYKINKSIYSEIWEELHIRSPSDDFLRDIDRKFADLGFKKMEKFINFNKCKKCGMCAKKLCEAKWTPINYLKKANVKIISNFNTIRIEKNDCWVVKDKKGRDIKTKNLIISAGGINSPRLLKKVIDDDNIGKNLFVDIFITIGGILKDSYLNKDISMLMCKQYKDFILTTHYSQLLYNEITKTEKTNKIKGIKEKDVIGIMIKIRDENNGIVLENELKKEITKNDFKILARGISKGSKYLHKLGVEEIYSTHPRGSHPGGSLSLVVDEFEVKEGLYVCDASLFKETLGLPPIVSIIALSKKLVKEIL
ncbi:glucose-methanol-choline oxidoreductase [Methanocaldococcus vulcanius M7]|uniref:Glucose-methanol-choline oxidoreductase n=1 Tax=Methanocaldococcus vulcanius (strain ATCC 700851 / DSM 12094 / M7) TaxID=579137 RepID=C9RHE0_METVM|nr:GMC family oxidoreductase N-terminal domain-containing protein [Methanocaldococcus vulcanius]ACX72992.1 glucose-methanol-choline oxidoreductase [Methanocaldococcus vulcanius M7]